MFRRPCILLLSLSFLPFRAPHFFSNLGGIDHRVGVGAEGMGEGRQGGGDGGGGGHLLVGGEKVASGGVVRAKQIA